MTSISKRFKNVQNSVTQVTLKNVAYAFGTYFSGPDQAFDKVNAERHLFRVFKIYLKIIQTNKI